MYDDDARDGAKSGIFGGCAGPARIPGATVESYEVARRGAWEWATPEGESSGCARAPPRCG